MSGIKTISEFSAACKTSNILDAIIKSLPNAKLAEFEYEGFDAAHLHKLFFELCIKHSAEDPVQMLVEICAIGYSRGNLHSKSVARSSSEGQRRIKELAGHMKFKFRADGKSPQGNPGKNGLTFVRATAVYPYVVSELLFKGADAGGLARKHVMDAKAWKVNDLPAPMCFTNFISSTNGLEGKVKHTITVAWMAWQHCFLMAILRDKDAKAAVNQDYMEQQAIQLHSNATIDVAASKTWLVRWGIVASDGKIPKIIREVAHNYLKHYNASYDVSSIVAEGDCH